MFRTIDVMLNGLVNTVGFMRDMPRSTKQMIELWNLLLTFVRGLDPDLVSNCLTLMLKKKYQMKKLGFFFQHTKC